MSSEFRIEKDSMGEVKYRTFQEANPDLATAFAVLALSYCQPVGHEVSRRALAPACQPCQECGGTGLGTQVSGSPSARGRDADNCRQEYGTRAGPHPGNHPSQSRRKLRAACA